MTDTDFVAWRDRLHEERAALIQYLRAKCEAEDWHGASDACCDLRDVDAQLEVLERVLG